MTSRSEWLETMAAIKDHADDRGVGITDLLTDICKYFLEGKRWHVYLLRCSDNSLYCGMTSDLECRLIQHNAGKGSKYVRSRLPAKLVWSKAALSKSDTLKIEASIKKMTKAAKEQMVSGD